MPGVCIFFIYNGLGLGLAMDGMDGKVGLGCRMERTLTQAL